MKSENNSVENGKSLLRSLADADRAAVVYFVGAAILYLLLAVMIGKGDQILSIFITNAWSDLSGDTPRTLSQMLLAQALNRNSPEIAIDLGSTLYLTAFLSFPFSVINGYIMRFIHKQDKGTVVVSSIAGYFLQAIIALAWTDPVSMETVSADLSSLFVNLVFGVMLVGSIGSMLRAILRGEEIDIHNMTTSVVSIPMTLVYVIAKELFKSIVITTAFLFIVQVVVALATEIGFPILINIFSLISPIVYLVLFGFFDKLGEVVSKFAMKMLIKDSTFEYRQTWIGELFCLVSAVLMLVVCFSKHF